MTRRSNRGNLTGLEPRRERAPVASAAETAAAAVAAANEGEYPRLWTSNAWSGANTYNGTVTFKNTTRVEAALGTFAIQSTTATNGLFLAFENGAGTNYLGVENSTGTMVGATAYDLVAVVPSGRGYSFVVIGTGVVGRFTSAGLTITLAATAASFRVGANQVVAARQAIGAQPTPYAGNTHTAAYVQATVQALDNAAKATSARLDAIETALRTHGLLGT